MRLGTVLAPAPGMPERQTVERARAAMRAGKAPSTQAGEFVREEIHHVREGKHGARSTKGPAARKAAARKAAATRRKRTVHAG